MKNFWSFTGNDKFNIGCTGSTVYIYDKNNKELAKFKDINYAYSSLISPDGDILTIKSTDGKLAIYSLETMSLIKKFRFSKVDGCQDENSVFSADGKLFYNIEHHGDSCKTALSIYNTESFELKKMLFADNHLMVLTAIEREEKSGQIFLLGYFRDENTGVAAKFFVGQLIDEEIEELRYISQSEHMFYQAYKLLEMDGFTEKAKEWSYFKYFKYDVDKIQEQGHSLAKLWTSINNK